MSERRTGAVGIAPGELLAVDGGQSSIRLRYGDETTVLEVGGVSWLDGDVVALVADAVVQGWRQAGARPIRRAVLGLTTAPAGHTEADRLCARVAEGTGADEVWLADDAVTAHAGALDGGYGIALVVGTGVACLVLGDDDRPRIVGGHGFLLGDEGGAYWIGRRAIGEVLRGLEGRGELHDVTGLAFAAERRFGGDLGDLHVRIHAGERPVHAIASFAQDVLEAAENREEAALTIVDEAAGELTLLVAAAIRLAAGSRPAHPVPVALGGGLAADDTPLRRAVTQRIAEARLPATVKAPAGRGLDGAVHLGLGEDPGPYAPLVHVWRRDEQEDRPGSAGAGSAGGARSGSAGRRYLGTVRDLVGRLVEEEWPRIDAAAELMASTIAKGGSVHVFGTGHSHMLAEELYYRAGGLVAIAPILVDDLMLHVDAVRSTELERIRGRAARILADHPIGPRDLLIVASNSGGNAVTAELALLAKEGGTPVVAVTSLRHATSAAARASDLPRLHEIADVTLDNGGAVGDAAVEIAGFGRRVAPTSTVIGAALLDAVAAEAIERLVARGIRPDVYTSANVEGGDAANAAYTAGARR